MPDSIVLGDKSEQNLYPTLPRTLSDFCLVTVHTSCSPLVFEAEYTFQALGSLYASATASSFHEFSSMVNFLFGFGIVAAVDDDVITNLVTLFSLLAASRILWTELITPGITSSGLDEKETSPATWAMPWTPVYHVVSIALPDADCASTNL